MGKCSLLGTSSYQKIPSILEAGLILMLLGMRLIALLECLALWTIYARDYSTSYAYLPVVYTPINSLASLFSWILVRPSATSLHVAWPSPVRFLNQKSSISILHWSGAKGKLVVIWLRPSVDTPKLSPSWYHLLLGMFCSWTSRLSRFRLLSVAESTGGEICHTGVRELL